MLPPFDEFGYLPAGIHKCTADEVVKRFGFGSPEREVETQELFDFLTWARRTGIVRVIINGSYATSKSAPNDVDIVALPGREYPRDGMTFSQLAFQWPFLQVLIAADNDDLEAWALQDFGTDRNRRTKGVIEVQL